MQDIDAIARYWESELELNEEPDTEVRAITSPIAQTWIWSDLHLGDPGPLAAFDRPFPDVDAMNRHLLARWRELVKAEDTIICLGDVAHANGLRDRDLAAAVAACPGRRVLIVGNHDTDPAGLAEADSRRATGAPSTPPNRCSR